jgi:intracellular multiplication protein IcmK
MRKLLFAAPVIASVLSVCSPSAAQVTAAPNPVAPGPNDYVPPAYVPPAAPQPGQPSGNNGAVAFTPGQYVQAPSYAPAPVYPTGYPAYPQQAAPGSYAPAPSGPPPGYVQAPGYGPAPVQGAQPLPPQQTPDQTSFNQALRELLPLSQPQVRQFRQDATKIDREGRSPPMGPAQPTSRSVTLSLKPGERAPELRLAPGNASVLTFSDQTGAPWPVMSVTVGNPQAYGAQEAGEKGKTNMVVISPLQNYDVSANLIVTLVGYPVPVLFSLSTGSDHVDYRLDVGIQARGPNAAYDITATSSLQPTNDSTVQSFLDGVAPKGAHRVHTSESAVEAWRFQDMLYVRTSLELLSPAYVARARNVSGTNIYTLADSPVLIVSQDGRMASVDIDR